MSSPSFTTIDELMTLTSSFVSEEEFALGEAAIGKGIHRHDGIWWIEKANFYCRPVHDFRCLLPGEGAPSPWKSPLGYSYRVELSRPNSYVMRWNILEGPDLREFSLDSLAGKKRSQIRQGLKNCRIEIISNIESLFPAMKAINIAQAKRFEAQDKNHSYLASSYYIQNEAGWRRGIRNIYSHPGHTFVGAFVGDHLAAYIDLIQIEDTWMFGAVKSHDDFLRHRPVDALYFAILSAAARNPHCLRVVNGGGEEREGLTRFKSQFLLKSTMVPYYTETLIPRRFVALARKLRLR